MPTDPDGEAREDYIIAVDEWQDTHHRLEAAEERAWRFKNDRHAADVARREAEADRDRLREALERIAEIVHVDPTPSKLEPRIARIAREALASTPQPCTCNANYHDPHCPVHGTPQPSGEARGLVKRQSLAPDREYSEDSPRQPSEGDTDA